MSSSKSWDRRKRRFKVIAPTAQANLVALGKLSEARVLYLQVLEQSQKFQGGTDSGASGRATVALANICEKEGKYDEAAKYCKELSAVKFLPPDLQYRTAKVMAAVLEHNGQAAEASKERAQMQQMKDTFGKSDPFLDDW